MKKVLLLTLALVSFISVNAQEGNKIGLKAGFNYNATNFDLVSQAVDNLTEFKSNNGWHAGIYYRGNIGNMFYWQPELMYSRSSVTVDHSHFSEEISGNTIDLNVLMGVKAFGFLRAYVGPTGSFNLGSNLEEFDAKSTFKTLGFGFQIGTGVDLFSFLTLDIAYKSSFSAEDGIIDLGEVKIPLSKDVSLMVISVGVMF